MDLSSRAALAPWTGGHGVESVLSNCECLWPGGGGSEMIVGGSGQSICQYGLDWGAEVRELVLRRNSLRPGGPNRVTMRTQLWDLPCWVLWAVSRVCVQENAGVSCPACWGEISDVLGRWCIAAGGP